MMSVKINTNDDGTSMYTQSTMMLIIIIKRHVTDDDTDASIQSVTMMIIKNHTIDDDTDADSSKGAEAGAYIHLVRNNVGTIFRTQHQNDSSHDQALLIANRIYKPTIMSQITN